LLSLSLWAQKKKPQLREDVDLPADFSIDFRLASQERSRIGQNPTDLVSSYIAGNAVFEELVQSPTIAVFGLPYNWRARVIDSDQINAHALPDGEIIVDGGLARLLGTNRGLWAAVLSHEVTHTSRRHWVKKFLYRLYIEEQREYWRIRARYGDDAAPWALLALSIAAPIAEGKLSRDLEHQADAQGMILMARQGYHPDNVFALHHLLRIHTGEQSKIGAFFSSHPRWQTRDERSDRAYADALTEYNRYWSDPERSPGGPPPVVAFLEKPTAKEDKKQATAEIAVPLSCRNAREPVLLSIRFTKDQRDVPSTLPEYRDEKGNLMLRQVAVCPPKGGPASPIVLRMPAAAVSERDRKLKAVLAILGPDGQLLELSKDFDVRFPKVDRKSIAVQAATQPTNQFLADTSPQDTTAAQPERSARVEPALLNTESPEGVTSTPGLVEKAAETIHENALSITQSPHSNQYCIDCTSEIGASGQVAANGVLLTKVEPDGPADKSGLKPGDVIVAIDDRPIRSLADLSSEIALRKPGTGVVVTYRRKDTTYRVRTEVRQRHAQ